MVRYEPVNAWFEDHAHAEPLKWRVRNLSGYADSLLHIGILQASDPATAARHSQGRSQTGHRKSALKLCEVACRANVRMCTANPKDSIHAHKDVRLNLADAIIEHFEFRRKHHSPEQVTSRLKARLRHGIVVWRLWGRLDGVEDEAPSKADFRSSVCGPS